MGRVLLVFMFRTCGLWHVSCERTGKPERVACEVD
jgi:hypothetical protein